MSKGIFNRTEVHKRRISEALKKLYKEGKLKLPSRKGISPSEAAKLLLRKAKLGKSSNFKDKHHSEEAKRKNREAHLGSKNPNFGKHFSKEHKRRLSESNKGKFHPLHSEEWKENNSKLFLEKWKDNKWKEKHIKSIIKGNHIKPTLPEKDLGNIIDRVAPNQYMYSGDGKIVFPCGCPDYWNINGQKKAILMHGIYWHLWKLQKDNNNPNLTKEDIERIDKEKYRKCGIDCLIIWDDELKNVKDVEEKIHNFNTVNIG